MFGFVTSYIMNISSYMIHHVKAEIVLVPMGQITQLKKLLISDSFCYIYIYIVFFIHEHNKLTTTQVLVLIIYV